MKYETRIMKVAVGPANVDSYSELITTVEVVDEAGGEFVEVRQQTDNERFIRIDKNEWPEMKAAIETMIGYCRESE